MAGYRYDIFISYVRKGVSGHQTDELIERLRQTINVHGEQTRIFVDREMSPGGFFPEKLEIAIGSSRRFLALITNDYFQREYCDLEFQIAFARDPSSRRGLIVPVIFEVGAEQTIKPEFSRIQQLSLTRSDFFEKLCESLGIFDPRSADSGSQLVPNPVLSTRDEPFLTADGFLLVRGIQFAKLGNLANVWLSRTPIKVSEYRTIMGAGAMPPHPRSNRNWAYNDYPVVQIKWNEANAFCRELGGRLPFFREWHAALGHQFAGVQCDMGQRSEGAWDASSFDTSCTITGLKSQTAPNELGFYDLVGNVWEWLGDVGEKPNDRWVCGGPNAPYRCLVPGSFRLPGIGLRCVIENSDSGEGSKRRA